MSRIKLYRETMDDRGIGFVLARGWECWVLGIQINNRAWMVEW